LSLKSEQKGQMAQLITDGIRRHRINITYSRNPVKKDGIKIQYSITSRFKPGHKAHQAGYLECSKETHANPGHTPSTYECCGAAVTWLNCTLNKCTPECGNVTDPATDSRDVKYKCEEITCDTQTPDYLIKEKYDLLDTTLKSVHSSVKPPTSIEFNDASAATGFSSDSWMTTALDNEEEKSLQFKMKCYTGGCVNQRTKPKPTPPAPAPLRISDPSSSSSLSRRLSEVQELLASWDAEEETAEGWVGKREEAKHVQPMFRKAAAASGHAAPLGAGEKKGFACHGLSYVYGTTTRHLVLHNQTCIDDGFAQLDDGLTMGHSGSELSMAHAADAAINLQLKYRGVLPVPFVLRPPVPTPAPQGPTPVPHGQYHVLPGIYQGGTTVMGFYKVTGTMGIRPENLDMAIIINKNLVNITCPHELYTASATDIKLPTFNDKDDCVGKNMRLRALTIKSIDYDNKAKTIGMHVL
jgi:hypothetical protein